MKKNIALLLVVTMVISLFSACQKENTNENEANSSETITEVPANGNESTQSEGTDLTGNNETSNQEDTASTDNNQMQEDTASADNNGDGKQKEATSKVDTDKNKQEDKITTGGKETSKQDKTSTGSKETSKQNDKTTTESKKTVKQKDKTTSGGKETSKHKDKNSSGNKDSNNQDESSNKDNTEQGGLKEDLSTIIDKIYGIKDPGLRLVSSPIDLTNKDAVKYNTGLEDVSKVKEIVVSEAMMSSQAYSLALVRVKDAADAKSVAEAMLEGIDPAKWICVRADDLKIVTYHDVVMLIMMGSQLSEKVTSDQIVDAFKGICGGKLDLELKK